MTPTQCALLLAAASLAFVHAKDAHAGPPPQNSSAEKNQKLPRPVPLGRGIALERDPASGELRATRTGSSPGDADGVIRARVTLVQVPCTVEAPDGTEVRGLSQSDFRLLEDSARGL